MGTTAGGKKIATTKSGHQAVAPPAVSLNPPTPPAGPVPGPYVYTARSATASKTHGALKVGGAPVLVKGSAMDIDPPANQPSQPTGGDVVTHAVKGKAVMKQGSGRTKSGGKGVCRTGDIAAMNVPTPQQQLAQASAPLLEGVGAGGSGAGGSGSGGGGGDGSKRAQGARPAKKAGGASGPDAPKCTLAGEPVDVASGHVVHDTTDLFLPGAIPLLWERAYSSARAKERTSLGRGGWTHSFEQWIEEEAEVLTLRAEDGRDIYFAKVKPGGTTFHRRERLVLAADRRGGYTVASLDTRLARDFAPLQPGGRAVLRSIRDPYGNRIALHYTGGRLARLIDTAGREVRIQSDDKGRVVRVEVWATDPQLPASPQQPAAPSLQRWFDYAYHVTGELAKATNALGHADLYEYDGHHRLIKTTWKNGVSFHYKYDEDSGFCVRTWGDGGLRTVELHPDRATRTTRTSGTEEPRLYTWNDEGVVVREATPDGMFVRETTYDNDLYLTSEANAAGETTRYEYDARGNRTRVIDAAGNVTTWQYATDQPFKRTDPDGLVTEYAHDTRGAMIAVTYPDGLRYTIDYDSAGRSSAVHGPDGLLIGYTYDAQHNLVQEVDARGARTAYTCDALGQAISRVDALGRLTAVEYDALGQPTSIRYADGTTGRVEYDPLGNPARVTDPLGQVTAMEHAGTGVLAKLTQPDGQAWHFAYDRDERLRQIKNPRAELYEFEYDRAGRIAVERAFDGRIQQYRYSKAELLTRVEYPDQTWREFSHDPLGNVVEERSPHGGIAFERDKLGRIQKAVLDDHSGPVATAFERDRLGRIVAETQGERTLRYDYDDRGRRAARTLPDGSTTRYFHDVLGALTGVDHDGRKVLVQRDILGREARRHIYAGSVDILSSYDAMDRLLEQRVTAPAPAGAQVHAVLSQRRWRYDAIGRVLQIEDSRWGTTLYQYDRVDQLIEARRGSRREVFEYDVTGSLQNVLSDLAEVGRVPPWQVETGNVLLRTNTARYEVDRRGRRTKKIEASGNGQGEAVTEYLWDCRDRLREVRLPSGERVLFTYDAFGRRVRKEVVPAAQRDFPAMVKLAVEQGREALPKVRRTEFLWDGAAIAGDIDPEGGTRSFVHEPGSLVPMLQAEQGEVFAYVNDHLGTPKELIDEDGRIAWSAAHSAWGAVVETWRDPASRPARARPIESPFRLLGQYHDEETGLASALFRYFDAETGRWMSPDPLGFMGGPNLHAFDGSPTIDIDPLGLMAPCRNGGLVRVHKGREAWLRAKAEFTWRYGHTFRNQRELDAGWSVYQQSSGGKHILIIGSAKDTFGVEKDVGRKHRILSTENWSPRVNDIWVRGGIDRGATFYLGTDTDRKALFNDLGGRRVYKRELGQLKAAGYTRHGNVMLPPGAAP